MMKLSGRVALVTGSARGIGAAIVKSLAKEGAAVVINYVKNEERARQLLDEIKTAGGKGIIVQADVSKAEDVNRMVAEALKAFGKVDILVNNAVGQIYFNPITDSKWEQCMEEFNIITRGAYLCCKAVIPGMMERKYGRIINIGASAGAQPFLKIYGYWMGKYALLAMTRTLALEMGAHGITVNSIHPGLIRTEIHGTWGPDKTGGKQTPAHFASVIARQAVQRMGEPEDVAAAVLYFASDEASLATGQYIHLSGGMVTTPLGVVKVLFVFQPVIGICIRSTLNPRSIR